MDFIKRLLGFGFTLHFHMKSGKTITVKGVKDFSYNYNATAITGLKIQWHYTPKRRPLIEAMALDQIEAIEREG